MLRITTFAEKTVELEVQYKKEKKAGNTSHTDSAYLD